jgi:HEAT repeat protein
MLVAALLFMAGPAGRAEEKKVTLPEVAAPWLDLLKSEDESVRKGATTILVELVRNHPALAKDLVNRMAAEGKNEDEHQAKLVPLAKESPATVSALIRLIREPSTDYRARNFGVKVLSRVGPTAATTEFVEALAETHCPVPGSFFRVMRAMGKDAIPILAAGFRHSDSNIHRRSEIALRVISRNEPAVKKVYEALQAEGARLQRLREATPAERIVIIGELAELAPSVPGTATLLVKAMNDQSDKDVLADAESQLIVLGRQLPEVAVALVAGIRSEDEYRLRKLAMKVLPKVGANLNCKEMVEALGDHHCPVPGTMNRILVLAGADALPVLQVAQKHANPDIRSAAERVLARIPKPAPVTASANPQP